MANEEHLAQLRQGVAAWNQWQAVHSPPIWPDLTEANLAGAALARAYLAGADLARVNLAGANLSRANLARANLAGAHLAGANLPKANLDGASLVEADFTEANLVGANLSRTNLSRADLSGTNLVGVQLVGANLAGANFHEAAMGWAELVNINLSTARGLETVQHEGPSTISIDTLYGSYGDIPGVFLRGAGVPDEMITYMKSLVGRPFEFYSCFISYSGKDQEFAERLHTDLQNKGVRCWFAPQDIQSGRKIHEQLDQAIHFHERLLLILSVHSMQSEWVKTEIAKARQREVQEKRQVLFPMRLVPFEAVQDWECFDADTGKDSACEIREYFIPDFSNWKNYDAYQEAFQRLLRDLKPPMTLA
jgi:hypothetical protein